MASQTVDPKLVSSGALFKRMRNAALKRKLSWNLVFKEFCDLVFAPCYWCGAPPSTTFNAYRSQNGYTQRTRGVANTFWYWILYNGIDRIDNKLPYTKNNCQTSCKWCNFARNNRTPEEFLGWLRRAYENNLHK